MGRPRSSPTLNPGKCAWCQEPLVQREDEPRHNFIKRTTCNKKHGSLARQNKARLAKVAGTTPEKQFGVKHFTPGTPGFAELAALYTKP